ncbi:hypothetical protein CALVIDRAFT_568150 [Calocera viscosa TUFC12733]|uniref:Uncharacterized protein n=1 Tax=Calocera viscosa (strain TUFC12733) TaxID=1330018 RepID=A0A167HG36_CALVF|nr:hypothetical protein CALVIDRAFT_568150 [Calocera viscosa TUFC12733]
MPSKFIQNLREQRARMTPEEWAQDRADLQARILASASIEIPSRAGRMRKRKFTMQAEPEDNLSNKRKDPKLTADTVPLQHEVHTSVVEPTIDDKMYAHTLTHEHKKNEPPVSASTSANLAVAAEEDQLFPEHVQGAAKYGILGEGSDEGVQSGDIGA